jgi:hypothetical protein
MWSEHSCPPLLIFLLRQTLPLIPYGSRPVSNISFVSPAATAG